MILGLLQLGAVSVLLTAVLYILIKRWCAHDRAIQAHLVAQERHRQVRSGIPYDQIDNEYRQ